VVAYSCGWPCAQDQGEGNEGPRPDHPEADRLPRDSVLNEVCREHVLVDYLRAVDGDYMSPPTKYRDPSIVTVLVPASNANLISGSFSSSVRASVAILKFDSAEVQGFVFSHLMMKVRRHLSA